MGKITFTRSPAKPLEGIIAGPEKNFQANIDQGKMPNDRRGAAAVAIHIQDQHSDVETFRTADRSSFLCRMIEKLI